MTIYDDLKSVAGEVLAEFKQGTIELIQSVPGTGPADDPGAPTETTTTLDAVARGVSFKYVQSGFAVATDLMVTAAVVEGITPTLNDFISIDGTKHKIVHNASAPAAGTICAWKFIVRSGG